MQGDKGLGGSDIGLSVQENGGSVTVTDSENRVLITDRQTGIIHHSDVFSVEQEKMMQESDDDVEVMDAEQTVGQMHLSEHVVSLPRVVSFLFLYESNTSPGQL